MKILIADDDLLCLYMLEPLLAKWGYDVVTADNGNEAWRILQTADSPRLALLDWKMPGMNGVEICKKVRKLEKFIYLILLTSKKKGWIL